MNEIDGKLAKNRYSTRTELIRDAIREKPSDLEKDEILSELVIFSKKRTSNERMHKARERVFEILGEHILKIDFVSSIK